MKYLLLIYAQEVDLTQPVREACYAKSSEIAEDLMASGQLVSAAPLHPTHTATSVRIREGKRIVTDGPFAETYEQLGGFFLVEAADIDEAISIAALLPVAQMGTIEVRPIVNLDRPFLDIDTDAKRLSEAR